MSLGTLLPAAAEGWVFASAILVLNATPGVDFLLTVSRTLQGGARAGIAAALGINAGCVVHALAAAFGLAALMKLHPQALRWVQWAGAAYLVWLGVAMLRQAARGGGAAAALAQAPLRKSIWADFRSGLFTNVLNPKVALFFLAFLPQFVPAASPNATLSFLLLGAWFVAQSMVFLLVLVALATQLARWQAPPAARRAIEAVGGLLFIGLALRIAGLKPAAS